MTGLPYGEAQAYQQQQSSAAMNVQDPTSSPSPSAVAGAAQSGAQPAFNRPTEMPSQPITNGVNIGAGDGSSALQLPAVGLNQAPSGEVTQTLRTLSARDTTGVLAALLDSASIRGV